MVYQTVHSRPRAHSKRNEGSEDENARQSSWLPSWHHACSNMLKACSSFGFTHSSMLKVARSSLSLPEPIRETCSVVLTFESVDEIL